MVKEKQGQMVKEEKVSEEQANKFIDSLPVLPDEIQIFENIIPEKAQNMLWANAILGIKDWQIGQTIIGTSAWEENDENKKIYEQFQFTTSVLDRGVDPGSIYSQFNPNQRNPDLWSFLMPLQFGALKLGAKVSLDMIIRCKLNLQTTAPLKAKDKYNLPHVDFDRIDGRKFLTAIYYLNDSDGDTFIFNEKSVDQFYNNLIVDGDLSQEGKKFIDNLTIRKRISPKKGTVMFFRGDTLHAGSHPTQTQNRLVLNYNFFPKRIIPSSESPYILKKYKDIFGDLT